MEVVALQDEQRRIDLVADCVESLLSTTPHAVLGLATGSSPLPVYREIIRRSQAGRLSFRSASAFTLDEYVGLEETHPERYRHVIEREFTTHVDLDPDAVHGPDGNNADLPAACTSYEEQIRAAGGVDLQILGIGTDGHIGFNEPGSSLASRTRIKTLTTQTRADNARFFGGDIDAVPRHCLTQGLGTIMESRHVILLATGRAKAEAVRQMVEGPVSALWPATLLQHHPHATVVLDAAAASRLRLAGYFREAFEGKPAWQGI